MDFTKVWIKTAVKSNLNLYSRFLNSLKCFFRFSIEKLTGFSQKKCFSAAAASLIIVVCVFVGEQINTASISGSFNIT